MRKQHKKVILAHSSAQWYLANSIKGPWDSALTLNSYTFLKFPLIKLLQLTVLYASLSGLPLATIRGPGRCVCLLLLVCVHLLKHYSFLFVFQWGIKKTTEKWHKPQECVWGKAQEGWRLRRMLLSSSVTLQPLPPFCTSEQPHRLKISHCYTYTKGHGKDFHCEGT